MPESAGYTLLRSWDRGAFPDGVPAVVIVHGADPRYLQCMGDSTPECRSALAIDRVAWAAGRDVELALPDDPYALMPRMSIGEVQQVVGDGRLITASVVQARDAINFDPRLHEVGDDIVWVVRSLKSTPTRAADPTRAVAVELLSDQTGQVIESLDLALSETYLPALFRPQASALHVSDNDDHVFVYRVELPDGTPVLESQIGGWTVRTSAEGTQHNLPGPPAVLDPGEYVVTAWRSQYASYVPVFGTPEDECTASIDLAASEAERLEASFPKTGPCTWVEPTFDATLY